MRKATLAGTGKNSGQPRNSTDWKGNSKYYKSSTKSKRIEGNIPTWKCKMTSGEAGNDNKRQEEKWGHIPAQKGFGEDWSLYPCS